MNWTKDIEVFNEDCMVTMSRYEDNHFDLAIVDPPYGMPKTSSHGRGKLKNRALNKGKIQKWDIAPNKEYFDELFRVSKNQIIWGGNYFDLPPTRCFIVWDKEQPWENFSAAEYAWASFDKPSKIFKEATTRTGEKKIHPTQKSMKLYNFCLHHFAKEGFKIIDTHFGSGSHGIALDSANKIEKMELTLVASEIDKEYYNDAKKRFDKETAWQSIF